jgi:CHAT domain-containing protein
MHLLTVVAAQAQNTSLPRLRYVAREAEEVVDAGTSAGVSVGSVLPSAATEEVLAAISSAHIVHFACHGIQDDAEPHKSHFCLSSGDLSISDLMGVNLDNAFLAFLSACETAQGDRAHADEVIHLAAAMLFAGFKSVVATLWSVLFFSHLAYDVN